MQLRLLLDYWNSTNIHWIACNMYGSMPFNVNEVPKTNVWHKKPWNDIYFGFFISHIWTLLIIEIVWAYCIMFNWVTFIHLKSTSVWDNKVKSYKEQFQKWEINVCWIGTEWPNCGAEDVIDHHIGPLLSYPWLGSRWPWDDPCPRR